MKLPKFFDTKQPLSLKWKWGILLLVSFFIVSLAGVTFYHKQTMYSRYNHLKEISQQRFNIIENMLSGLSEPFQKEDFVTNTVTGDKTIVDYLTYLENEDIVVRLFNNDSQLIFETRKLTASKSDLSKNLSTVVIDGTETFIGNTNVVSRETNQTLGTFQFLVSPEVIKKMEATQQKHLLTVLLILTILATVISIFISNRFLRPLTYLNNSLDLVEEENLSELRVRKPSSNDEWSDLSIHVNRLLDKIDLYVRNQKQFVEDVSHELRTPVAIVEGHLKMLNRWGKEDPEILEESISASLQEITRMKGLVQEMLDLSRADHVDIDYKDEITEVNSTTRQVFNNFVILYPDFQFYLDSEKDDKELYVRIFRNHFEQILIILLDNAVKYSRERQEIHVSVSQTLTKVEIAVQDFGEGMTDEDKERVFGRFYRVDKARSRNKGGNGLGLSIAKQLVEGYKGDVRVESVLNHGSIFYVEFPILSDTRQVYKLKQIAQKKNL